MPYDERTVEELYDSADITPMGIQLEVNAEIFTTVHNLLCCVKKNEIDEDDLERIYELWRQTTREMSRIELRKGYGISMEKQIDMLNEARDIEMKYTSDQVFSPVSVRLTKDLIKKESVFTPEEMDTLFETTVWPSVIAGKTGGQKKPMAFIIAGQPGSGKTRMSSIMIEEFDGDIIQSMSDNYRGFHPRAEALTEKYGQYCAFFTRRQGRYLSDLTMRRAAEEHYHILQEGSLEDVSRTLTLIDYLKNKGYTICCILRACPRKESWKAIHQLFLQQRLKAPGLSRLISKDKHDKACLSFLTATNVLIEKNVCDRLIIKSTKGLLYDSDDMPVEMVGDLLSKRMVK